MSSKSGESAKNLSLSKVAALKMLCICEKHIYLPINLIVFMRYSMDLHNKSEQNV